MVELVVDFRMSLLVLELAPPPIIRVWVRLTELIESNTGSFLCLKIITEPYKQVSGTTLLGKNDDQHPCLLCFCELGYTLLIGRTQLVLNYNYVLDKEGENFWWKCETGWIGSGRKTVWPVMYKNLKKLMWPLVWKYSTLCSNFSFCEGTVVPVRSGDSGSRLKVYHWG